MLLDLIRLKLTIDSNYALNTLFKCLWTITSRAKVEPELCSDTTRNYRKIYIYIYIRVEFIKRSKPVNQERNQNVLQKMETESSFTGCRRTSTKEEMR